MENSVVREAHAGAGHGVERKGSVAYGRLALLGVVGYLMEIPVLIAFYKTPPGVGSTEGEIAAFYAANRADILTAIFGVTLALLALLAFGAGLRSVLRQAAGAGEAGVLADLAFGCLVVGVGLEVAGLTFEGVAAEMTTYGDNPPVLAAAALAAGGIVVSSASAVARVAFVALAALAMLGTRVLPRWLGWTGLVSALAYGAGSVVLAYDPSSALGAVQFGGWLLMIAWMLATGIVLFRRAGNRTERLTSEPSSI